MTQTEYLALYEKYLAGKCSMQETELLEKYRDDFSLIEMPWSEEMGDRHRVKDTIHKSLHQDINKAKGIYKFNFKPWAIAASIVFIFSVGLLSLFNPNIPHKSTPKITKVHDKVTIRPGGNKAMLTLANGSVINLDGSKTGTLAIQKGVSVKKLADGKLVYDLKQQDLGATAGYNTVTTPRGGQYELVLSDGTRVWLNAATVLKYPTVFTGKERRVELTGEAYFEVAKNKNMPFNVSTKGMNVRVLGTHFNVMAYDDDKTVETTLLEGAVKLSNNRNNAILKPGQQGVMRNGESVFDVHSANVDDAVAWKNGFFSFNNESIQSIMKKISRWYDVDVEYSGTLVKKNFGGTVSKFNNVAEVLKTMELTGTIHFEVEGRRIIVMP